MVAVIDRKFGCFDQVVKSGTTYPYRFKYLEAQVGRKFDIYSTFIDYSIDYPGNPTPPTTRSTHQDIADAAADGKDLLVAFQTNTGYFATPGGTYAPKQGTFAELLAGTYDTVLTNIFTWLFSLGVNVTVRPFWEANLPESLFYPADSTTSHKAASATYSASTTWTTTGGPVCTSNAQYKAAFAYFVTLLRSLPNASARFKSFYCPGANDPSTQVAAGASGATLVNMYPDPSVVDYNGYDSYNTLSTTKYLTPTETLMGYRESDSTNRFAYDLFANLNSKPIWLGEINCMDTGGTSAVPGAANTANGHSKAQWYTDFFNLDATVAPLVTTINWFDEPGTQSTWPFNSSVSALAAFQQGFNFGSGTTQHGVVADAYDPGSSAPIDPEPLVAFPFDTARVPGQGSHSALHNKVGYILNRLAGVAGSYIVGKFGTDGSVPALTLTSDMGSSAFTPVVQFAPPAPVGATVKYLMGSRISPDTYYRWRLRSDGRQDFGPGDTGDTDVTVQRAAANTLGVTAGTSGDAKLSVATLLGKFLNLTDQSAPSTPGAGAAVVHGSASGVAIRDGGGSFAIRQEQHQAVFAAQVMPYDPVVLVTTGTPTPPTLTAGILSVTRVRVHTARTVSRLALGVHTAGATLTASQCFMGLYDNAGNLLCQTADQSTAWTTTGLKNVAPTTTPTIEPGTYYLAVLGNGTTMPRMYGIANTFGNYTGTARFGSFGSALTALPATITVGSIAASGNAFHFSLT